MASDRLAAIKAFDETNAGVKGLVDAGVTAVPAFFRHPPDPLSQSACPDAAAIPVVDLSGSRSEVVGALVSNDRADAAGACAPAVADAVGPPCYKSVTAGGLLRPALARAAYKSVTAEELLRSSIAQTLGDLRL
ncbi:hypothetical protein TRIUR3_21674 [Triticum urartu]|uniref:Uncharacterized protein n=1 Tax=Triticum urartu TaxID=4572 RepID=M8ATE3_TRIUA|nr:hypothetical protein TRIUR3_21674 [Triticum urartu]